MADSATFTLNLAGNLEDNADASESALQALRQSILETTAETTRMQAALTAMKKGGLDQSNAAFRKLSDQLDVHKKSIAQATARYTELGGEFGKIEPPTEKLSFLDELMGAVDLSATAVVGAVAAVVAVLGALAIGLVAAAAKLTMFAISSSDAARSQRIMLDAMLGSSAAAASLQGAIGKVAASTSIGRDEILGYAKQLHAAGLSGAQLEEALQAVSNAASVGADTGKIVSQLAAAKNSAQQFNKVIDRTNGLYGDLAKQSAIGFGAQMTRLKESIGELFSGLDLEPFLKGLRSITKLFDSNTASGKALKSLITAVFQPLLTGAAAAAPKVVWLFKEAIIWALKAGIAVLKVRNAIREALQGPNAGPIKAALYGILVPIALIAIAAATTVTALVIGFGLVAAAVFLAFLPFALLGAAIWYIVDAASTLGAALGDGVSSALDSAKEKLAAWVSIGKEFITGLATGIGNGLTDVVAAAKKVASGAVSAARAVLDSHSPSRVMMSVGRDTSEGMAIGMDDGASDVVSSAQSLAAAAVSGADGGPAGAGAKGGRGSGGLTIHGLTVNVHGVDGADDPDFAMKMAKAFEQACLMAGFPIDPEYA
ncbi:MAG: hypothetical protein H6718_03210 [Polyangiaceae bacterium]|nr:hypothetical protein [Myxococcales bacterium]MCB9584375.1 hypothetical protein [Polyangiaceae bacterium]